MVPGLHAEGDRDSAQGKRKHGLDSDRLQAMPKDRGRIQDERPEKDISMKGEKRCQMQRAEDRKESSGTSS